MTYQTHSPNSFRASVLQGTPESPLVTGKTARSGRDGEAPGGLTVPRAEARRCNQRDEDRHRLTGQQASIHVDGATHVVELVNLSGGGAMIEGDVDLKLWDRVVLSFGDYGEIECALCWVRGNRFGLEFAEETQLDCDPEVRDSMLRDVIRKSFPELEAPIVPRRQNRPEKRRSAVRHPMIWNGLVHHDHESSVARLRNISATGALIEGSGELPEGASVLLDLGGAGTVPARVGWSRGCQAGLRFEREFDLSTLSNMRPEIADGEDALPTPQSDTPVSANWNRLSIEELSRTLGG